MTWQILHGDALGTLRGMAAGSVHAAITSPPYFGLRAYAGDQAVDWPAVEFYPMAYVGHTVAICRELRRVLRADGLLWWNLGDAAAVAEESVTPGDNRAVRSDNTQDCGRNGGEQ